MGNYSAERCDLCECTDAEVLVHATTGRSLLSDRRIVHRDLRKLRCLRCGLVREGHSASGNGLIDYYEREYTVAPDDYVFYTPNGPVARSTLFCDWLTSAFGVFRWKKLGSCLEIGAGGGALLSEFQKRFPTCCFEGFELSSVAARQARERGLRVRQAPLRGSMDQTYDAVYSIAVLEHVDSPTRFLVELRQSLHTEGLLFLCQPTQDIPSLDVFFVDHLHHLATDHLRGYARKCGFRELGFVVGQEWMPNFSLHLWQATDSTDETGWHGPPARSSCADIAAQIKADMERLNWRLDELKKRSRRVAVFGLNEVYALARAYSDLGSFPIVCGLHDQPDHPSLAGIGFPVIKPEACSDQRIDDVILAVNKVYHAQLLQRLGHLGATIHTVLN